MRLFFTRHPELLARALPWLCGIVAFFLAKKGIVGRTSDFAIYLDTAREFRAGGFDLFRERATTGPWLYPHCVVLPIAGLQLLFSDAQSTWLWCVLLALGTVDTLRTLVVVLRHLGGMTWWQWLTFGVLFQRCLAQNLTHGQLSLFVAMSMLRGVRCLLERRDAAAGCWLGLGAVLKLSPLLFLLALPLMHRGRAAAAMAVFVAIAVLVTPWPFCGTAEHGRHLADFVHAVHGASLDAEASARLLQSHAGPSIAGTFDYLLQPRPYDAEGRTVNVFDVGDDLLRVVKITWSLLLGGLLALWFWQARRHGEPERLAMQASAVMLAMAFFSPLVRVYHLGAALLPFALFARGPRSRRCALWLAVATALLFAMTLRQRNLLGEQLWRAFDTGALLHGALVAMLVWFVRESRPPPTQRA